MANPTMTIDTASLHSPLFHSPSAWITGCLLVVLTTNVVNERSVVAQDAKTSESFVMIHSVSGNRLQVSIAAGSGQSRGRQGRGGNAAGGPTFTGQDAASSFGQGRGRGRRDSTAEEIRGKIGGSQPARGAINAQADGARGRGMRFGGGDGPGRGNGRAGLGQASSNTAGNTQQIVVPSNVKITAAMRERRTAEFRVISELPGGLQNPVFRNIRQPLQARIVTKAGRMLELNVITGDTDINQSGTDETGQTVIAIRPKRPPSKRSK